MSSSEKQAPTIEPVLKANQFFYGNGNEKALVTVSRSYKDELESWTYQRLGGQVVESKVLKDLNIALYNAITADALTFIANAAKHEKEQREKEEAERKAKEEAERKAFENLIRTSAPDLFADITTVNISTYRKEITFYADSNKKQGIELEESVRYPSHGRYYIPRRTETGTTVYIVGRSYREKYHFTKLTNAINKIRELLKIERARQQQQTSEFDALTLFAKDSGMKLYKGYESYGHGRDMKSSEQYYLIMQSADNDYSSTVSLKVGRSGDGVVAYGAKISKPLTVFGKYSADHAFIDVNLHSAKEVREFMLDVLGSLISEKKKQ